MSRSTPPICPHHFAVMSREDTKYGVRWVCLAPGCTVMCWHGTTSTPADAPTRQARASLHRIFDPLWRDPNGPFRKVPNHRSWRRTRAYEWLATKLGKRIKDTHIGYFDLSECRRAHRLVLELLCPSPQTKEDRDAHH